MLLQSRRIIHKRPRQVELLSQFPGEGFGPERPGGVMAAVEQIQAEFLRHGISPMRPLARDERVHTFLGGSLQFASGAAGAEADALTDGASPGNDHGLGAQHTLEALLEFLQGQPRADFQAHVLVLVEEKWLGITQTQKRAELGVVPQSGVHVEWKMRTVDCQVATDEEPEHFVGLAGPRMAPGPE